LKACLHYHLFEEDFDIIKTLHLNAYRFSLEWSRIEPHEGSINSTELQHYHRVLDTLIKRKIIPVVVLFHFTIPLWFYRKGGFMKRENIKYFLRFVELVVREFSSKVKYWIIINEPNVYAYQGFINGIWPPFLKSTLRGMKVLCNLFESQKEGYKIIRKIYSHEDVFIGLSEHMVFLDLHRECLIL